MLSSKFILSLLAVAPSVRAVAVSSLGCPPDVTLTARVQITTVATVTVTSGSTSGTSYVFLPGSPPPTLKRRVPSPKSSSTAAAPTTTKKRSPCKANPSASSLSSTSSEATSTSDTNSSSATLSAVTTTSACPTQQTLTITQTGIATSISTVTVAAARPTRTAYPCSNMVNNRGPAYGDASDANNLNTQGNSIYYLNQPEGASPEACCNTCFFELQNCVQAYWYSYEGCVVSQANNLTSASGDGISTSCPAGTFDGLSYGPDKSPAFRSTGNIAGPCGQEYTNF